MADAPNILKDLEGTIVLYSTKKTNSSTKKRVLIFISANITFILRLLQIGKFGVVQKLTDCK
jgi:hypothetical protein